MLSQTLQMSSRKDRNTIYHNLSLHHTFPVFSCKEAVEHLVFISLFQHEILGNQQYSLFLSTVCSLVPFVHAQVPEAIMSIIWGKKKDTLFSQLIFVSDFLLLFFPNSLIDCLSTTFPFQNQMEELSLMVKESLHSNHTIWFGHYPTSTIISPAPGIRALMRQGLSCTFAV